MDFYNHQLRSRTRISRGSRLPKQVSGFTLCAALLVPACALATTSSNSAKVWQTLSSIEAAALRHVKNAENRSYSRVESRVKALDQRLKLARCPIPLQTFTPSRVSSGATQVIGVRCTSGHPWKIYVQVSTAYFKEVIVARRPLQRGKPLRAEDIDLQERDITRLQNRYLTSTNQLIGQVLKRDVSDQAILSPHNLSTQNVIKRGQTITLIARNSRLNVRMRGEALGNAGINERIRVKNLSSSRTVEGVVQSGTVVLVDH